MIIVYSIIKIENKYKETEQFIFITLGISILVIAFNLTLNELVETDKIGGIFFMNLGILLYLMKDSDDNISHTSNQLK